MFAKFALEMLEEARKDCLLKSNSNNRVELLKIDKKLKKISQKIMKDQENE